MQALRQPSAINPAHFGRRFFLWVPAWMDSPGGRIRIHGGSRGQNGIAYGRSGSAPGGLTYLARTQTTRSLPRSPEHESTVHQSEKCQASYMRVQHSHAANGPSACHHKYKPAVIPFRRSLLNFCLNSFLAIRGSKLRHRVLPKRRAVPPYPDRRTSSRHPRQSILCRPVPGSSVAKW
jgi:hypothetical protein